MIESLESLILLIDRYALAFHLDKAGMLGLKDKPRIVLGEVRDRLHDLFMELEALRVVAGREKKT